MRLVDVQRELGLARPTAHRILRALSDYGLAVRDDVSRRYRLGQEAAVLGWSVTSRSYDLRELCQDAMYALAEDTGDTVMLVVRSGFDSVCIDRKSGTNPIKVFTVEVGTRRPLGVGAGSIALLACLPDEEVRSILSSRRARQTGYPVAPAQTVLRAIREARTHGYAVSDGTAMQGVRGIAVAICDYRDMSVGAIGIAATAERLCAPRQARFAALLRREKDKIERKLRKEAPLGCARSGRARK